MSHAHVVLPNVQSADHRIRAMPAVTQINVRLPLPVYWVSHGFAR
jgi:hypothetical protein